VITHQIFVTKENILPLIADYDFVIDCTDNFTAKFLINDACVLANKPFSHAGVVHMQGQMLTYLPGEPCYRCLFEEAPPDGAVPTSKEVGILGATPGVIGALQATEAIKYLTGIGKPLTGAMLTYDALAMEFRRVRVPKNPHCAVCGEHPRITLQQFQK
jgi:molybdopterin/thiamine biosynthesis adenylyltransferase